MIMQARPQVPAEITSADVDSRDSSGGSGSDGESEKNKQFRSTKDDKTATTRALVMDVRVNDERPASRSRKRGGVSGVIPGGSWQTRLRCRGPW